MDLRDRFSYFFDKFKFILSIINLNGQTENLWEYIHSVGFAINFIHLSIFHPSVWLVLTFPHKKTKGLVFAMTERLRFELTWISM